MKYIVIFILALLALATAVDVPFKNCGSGSIIEVEKVVADVWPPTFGGSLRTETHGVASKTIANGSWEIITKYNGLKVDTQRGQLCEFGDVSCPIAPGSFTVVNEGVFPASSPQGTYQMRTELKSGNEVVYCYVIEFNAKK